MQMTKALFGGALFAAGLGGTATAAPTFLYSDTSADGAFQSFAYSSAFGGTPDVQYAPAALNTYSYGYSAYTGATAVTTYQYADNFGTAGAWFGGGYYGFGYGGTIMQQFFQVSENGSLVIEWDLTGTDGYAGTVAFEDSYSGATLFLLDPLAGDPLSGSVTIPVSAGVDYGIVLGLNDIFVTGFNPFFLVPGAIQFINVSVIPAPASLALLGAGGLLATRRRR